MRFNDFLDELNQKSIKIVFSEGKIKYEGPENSITPEVIERLKEFKGHLIRHHWPAECPNLMPINPVGNRIPFVMVYFEVMNYPLCDYLGKDQPFYGFLHNGSTGEKIKYKNVESFAADYIIQLQKIIPKGPYFLGGFSFGGVLAFEMAVQLQKAGFEVPFLAMLDSMTALSVEKIKWHNTIFKIIKSNILGPTRRKIGKRLQRYLCRLYLLLKKPVPIILRNFYIVDKYKQLTGKYRPGKFKGELLLFRSDITDCTSIYNGWEVHVDKVHVVTFKGSHLAIAREKEYAELIGKQFMDHLSRVYKPS